VAKILRKALWAESKKDEPDYQTALKYYLEALQQADVEELDPLCDEYTGIQLKIAEMYERLNMNQDALMIYSEIAAMYLDHFTAPGKLTDPVKRAHYIQKDLRVVIKMVQLNQSNVQASKMLLLTHFLIAQEEVSRRSKSAKALIDDENIELIQGTQADKEIGGETLLLDSSQTLVKDKQAWLPFRDELFNARDIYVAISLATGDLSTAIRTKVATTAWMLNADCNPGEILMSQTNLGSIIYLQAEEFETKEINSIKSKQDENTIKENKLAKEQCIGFSTQCYESVLEFSKKLPASLRRNETVEEAIALSTYGLGVIKLHLGQLDSAKSLLREARLRAKGSGFTDLVFEAERELERLQKEFEERGDTSGVDETTRIEKLLQQAENQPDIELDIQLVKHK
jgi:tetratricopeptide (TPR) repeat protein